MVAAGTRVQQLRAYISLDSPFYARQFIERLLKRIDTILLHTSFKRWPAVLSAAKEKAGHSGSGLIA